MAKFIISNLGANDGTIYIEAGIRCHQTITLLYVDDDIIVGARYLLDSGSVYVPRRYAVGPSFIKALSTVRKEFHIELSSDGIVAVASNLKIKAANAHSMFPNWWRMLDDSDEMGLATFNTEELVEALEYHKRESVVELRWKDIRGEEDERSPVVVRGVHWKKSGKYNILLASEVDMYSEHRSVVLEVPLKPLLKLVRSFKSAGIEEIAFVFQRADFLRVDGITEVYGNDYLGIIRLNKSPVYGKIGK